MFYMGVEQGTVFPAYAGVIPAMKSFDEATTCVPRVCGGDP